MPLNGVTSTLTPTNVSDATFRAWGSGVAAKLAAAGLVQTADTGQINWVTVLAPGAGSTKMGYEIWRFADALQATAPVYFKVYYGSATAAATPKMWFSFGTGSDGAGLLTGNVSVEKEANCGSAYATNPLDCFWSGSAGHFVVALFAGGTGATTSHFNFFSMERTKDANGVDTGEGILFISRAATTTNVMHAVFWDRILGTLSNETALPALTPEGTTGKNGSQVGVYPILQNKGIFLNPGLNALLYYHLDITPKGAVTFTMYGSTRVYMPIGIVHIAVPGTRAPSTTISLMSRYD